MNSHKGRRSFLNKVALGSLMALGMPEIALAEMKPKSKKLRLQDNDVILFQGDSITDAYRTHTETQPNSSKMLGGGYVFHTASGLLKNYPAKNLKIYNRGISGNKVPQLAERWEKDTLEIKPTVLSLLIGVNDFWHMKNGKYTGTADSYRNSYRELLKRTMEKLPELRLVILEPFALTVGAVGSEWFPAFSAYQNASKELADEFDGVFVPYQKIFNKAIELAPASYWVPDGVHPSIAGAKLMADSWLEIVKG